MVSKPIYEYEELLSDFGFIRCHQSHLVNKKYVKSWVKEDGGSLLLIDRFQYPCFAATKRRSTERAQYPEIVPTISLTALLNLSSAAPATAGRQGTKNYSHEVIVPVIIDASQLVYPGTDQCCQPAIQLWKIHKLDAYLKKRKPAVISIKVINGILLRCENTSVDLYGGTSGTANTNQKNMPQLNKDGAVKIVLDDNLPYQQVWLKVEGIL